jgi:hypothetical protein
MQKLEIYFVYGFRYTQVGIVGHIHYYSAGKKSYTILALQANIELSSIILLMYYKTYFVKVIREY